MKARHPLHHVQYIECYKSLAPANGSIIFNSRMYITSATDKSGDFAILKNIYGSQENKFVFPRIIDRSVFESVDSIKSMIREHAQAEGVRESSLRH